MTIGTPGFTATKGKGIWIPLFCIFVLALGVAWPGSAHARSKAIQFAPGATSAELKDAVARGETMTYLITATQGQNMNIQISSVEKNAVFNVRLPGKPPKFLKGAGEEDDAVSWKGELPVSGTYRIEAGATRGGADYTLRVEISK